MNDNIMIDAPHAPAIPAATLIVFRDKPVGPPDILFVERAGHMRFAAGAIVFPGGRVDPDDHHLALSSVVRGGGEDIGDRAARVAAVRETLEESGIAIGFSREPSPAWIAAARIRLHQHEAFSLLLSEADTALNLDHLTPFSRWRPNFKETRTFDTRFYIAQTHTDTPDPQVDKTENIHSFWSSAAQMLGAADAGEVRIIFPTRRNLERIALFAHYNAAQAQAQVISPDLICPFIEERGGERYLCIPDNRGYPVTAEALSSAVRG